MQQRAHSEPLTEVYRTIMQNNIWSLCGSCLFVTAPIFGDMKNHIIHSYERRLHDG